MSLSACSAAPATSFGSSACCSARARPSCWTWCGPRPSCCSPPARVSADAGLGGLAPGGACGCRASPPHGPLPGPEGRAMHAVTCAHAMWARRHSHTPIHMPTHMLSHTHTCMRTHMHVLRNTHMLSHMCTCTALAHMQTHVHAHSGAHPHIHTRVHVDMHAHTCRHMCSHTYTGVHIHVHMCTH